MQKPRDASTSVRSQWILDPEVTFLNHGSFGACPEPVLAAQRQWQERLERQPVRFMVRELEPLIDEAKAAVGAFVGARAEDLAFVPSATTGVNAVLRSLALAPGDELLTTNHGYNACRNTLSFVAERAGASVVVVDVPFPIRSEEEVVAAVTAGVTPKTRLALLDHITSPTGLVFPIARLVAELRSRGVETLVDGAHAPGMVDLDIAAIDAAYYTGNCHKWVCAPKGAAFLYVRPDLQDAVRPVTISHGANATRSDRSRYRIEFDWVGTTDPSPYLTIAAAIEFMGSLRDGGWPAVRAHNHDLVRSGRDTLCAALRVAAPAPDDMIGSLAAIPLPDGSPEPPASPLYTDPLQDALLMERGIEVPVVPWPAAPRRLIRISAQLYNRPEEYEKLATALVELL